MSFAANVAKNNLQVGLYSFYQQDNELFGAIFNDGSGNPPFTDSRASRPAIWKHSSSMTNSNLFLAYADRGDAADAFLGRRFGKRYQPALRSSRRVPRLHWVFRAFYGHYYQAPPLITASGPLLEFANVNNLGFIPLHGERDEEHQFGVTIPFRGWVLDADNFRTNVVNFFDHNNIGESNLFFPLTIAQGLIRGWELTLSSPLIARRGQIHLAYSNQIAEGGGAITGGLTDFSFPAGFHPLDHDQRNTLSMSVVLTFHGAVSRQPASTMAPVFPTRFRTSHIQATTYRNIRPLILPWERTLGNASRLQLLP